MKSIKGLISCSKDVLSGTPVFAGTRVPVQALMDYLEGGETLNEFLDDFPSVSRRQAKAVLARAANFLTRRYARAA